MEVTFEPREFVHKVKKLMRTPKTFYEDVEKEKGWKEAFSFSVIVSVIAALLGILEVTVLYPVFKDTLPSMFTPENKPQLLELLPAFFISTIFVVLLGFVWAGALHLWLRLWKIKGDYWSAYKAYTYSRAPNALFGLIPYVGFFFVLYSIYVLAVGISVHYKITLKKSLLLLIIPLVTLFILQAVVIGLFSSQFV